MVGLLTWTMPDSVASAKFIAVAMSPDGSLYIGEDKLDAAAFQQKVKDMARANPELEVQLRADKTVPYGAVAELIGWVQGAGLSRIAFVAEAK